MLLAHGSDISLNDINSSNVFHLIAGDVTDQATAIKILEVFIEHIKTGIYNPSVLRPAFSAVNLQLFGKYFLKFIIIFILD